MVAMSLFLPLKAQAISEYSRHVACNEAWRASPAATWQQCRLRSVHWDSFLWSLQTAHRTNLQKTMEHSRCWVHIACDHGAPLFKQGAHWGKINYTEVRKLRRCRSNPSVVNSTCEPLTMEEVQRVSQSTSGNHRLTVSDVTVTEGGYATFRLKLSRPVDFAVRYYYFTRAGTAGSGEDYEHRSGTVSIHPGHWSASVRIKTESDYRREGDERFFLDFKSLHTLGRIPGTWTWVHDPGAAADPDGARDDPQCGLPTGRIREWLPSPQMSSMRQRC